MPILTKPRQRKLQAIAAKASGDGGEKILLEEKIRFDQVFVLGFVFGFIHGFLGLGSGEWDCKNSNLEKVKKGKEEQESEVSDQFLK